MAKIETYPAILNSAISTSDQIIVNDASGPNTTKNMTFLEIDKRYVVTSGNSTVTGNVTVVGTVTATTLLGDGSGLTGIASGTGGVINTGSTTIGADSDADGTGVIAFQTRGTTKGGFENLGNFYVDTDLLYVDAVNGNIGVNTNSPAVIGANYTTVDVQGTDGTYILVKRTGATAVTGEFAADSGAVYVSSKTAHPVIFRYNDIEKMRLTTTGLGVGKTPIRIMDVEGSLSGNYVGAFFNTSATGNGVYVKSSSGGFPILVLENLAGTEVFRVNGTGEATFKNTTLGVAQIALDAGYTELTTGNYVAVDCYTGGLISVSVYVSGWGYVSGLFYVEHQSDTIVELADPSGKFEVTDTGSNFALYKASNTSVVYVKNRTGSTVSQVSVNVIEMKGN